MISDTRLPPAFHAFISGGRREPGDEVMDASFVAKDNELTKGTCMHVYKRCILIINM